jgi:NAD/NADP octopine/nopaline dehydrogenase, alpha-helical domain
MRGDGCYHRSGNRWSLSRRGIGDRRVQIAPPRYRRFKALRNSSARRRGCRGREGWVCSGRTRNDGSPTCDRRRRCHHRCDRRQFPGGGGTIACAYSPRPSGDPVDPGQHRGSLLVRRALDDAGCRAEVDVAEMDNYPYSCWRLSPTRIRPIVRKRWLQIATFPGNRIGEVFPRLSPLFLEAVATPNTLYTGFTNANATLHVANCVSNAGRIESGDSYKFYAEGVTPAVARVYEAINAERVAVAAALGASVPSLADWFDAPMGYAKQRSSRSVSALLTTAMGPIKRPVHRNRSIINSSPKTSPRASYR